MILFTKYSKRIQNHTLYKIVSILKLKKKKKEPILQFDSEVIIKQVLAYRE